jgi:hypothetical protein
MIVSPQVDLAIALYRHAIRRQFQPIEQCGQGQVFWNFAQFSIHKDIHQGGLLVRRIPPVERQV